MSTNISLKYLDAWLIILRLLIAGFMFTHGFPKFYKLMTGGEIQFREVFGLSAAVSLSLAVFAEVICSTLILIGLFTRLATVPLIITMLVAAFVAHANDPFARKEVALLYAFIYVTIAVLGPGKYSVDHLFTRNVNTRHSLGKISRPGR